jgi:hypothetical protein
MAHGHVAGTQSAQQLPFLIGVGGSATRGGDDHDRGVHASGSLYEGMQHCVGQASTPCDDQSPLRWADELGGCKGAPKQEKQCGQPAAKKAWLHGKSVLPKFTDISPKVWTKKR